jgi:hypothetical protein
VPSGSTVRDHHRELVLGGDGSARDAPGDIGAADQVAVPAETTMHTGEQTASGFGNPTVARRAGRGGAALIDEGDADACLFGLVFQAAEEVADPPGPDALVVPPPGLKIQHPAWVPDHQGPDPPLDGPVDDGLGGLMLGLFHPPLVPGLQFPVPGPVFTPPA